MYVSFHPHSSHNHLHLSASDGGACKPGDSYDAAIRVRKSLGFEIRFTAGKLGQTDKDVNIILGVGAPSLDPLYHPLRRSANTMYPVDIRLPHRRPLVYRLQRRQAIHALRRPTSTRRHNDHDTTGANRRHRPTRNKQMHRARRRWQLPSHRAVQKLRRQVDSGFLS